MSSLVLLIFFVIIPPQIDLSIRKNAPNININIINMNLYAKDTRNIYKNNIFMESLKQKNNIFYRTSKPKDYKPSSINSSCKLYLHSKKSKGSLEMVENVDLDSTGFKASNAKFRSVINNGINCSAINGDEKKKIILKSATNYASRDVELKQKDLGSNPNLASITVENQNLSDDLDNIEKGHKQSAAQIENEKIVFAKPESTQKSKLDSKFDKDKPSNDISQALSNNQKNLNVTNESLISDKNSKIPNEHCGQQEAKPMPLKNSKIVEKQKLDANTTQNKCNTAKHIVSEDTDKQQRGFLADALTKKQNICDQINKRSINESARRILHEIQQEKNYQVQCKIDRICNKEKYKESEKNTELKLIVELERQKVTKKFTIHRKEITKLLIIAKKHFYTIEISMLEYLLDAINYILSYQCNFESAQKNQIKEKLGYMIF